MDDRTRRRLEHVRRRWGIPGAREAARARLAVRLPDLTTPAWQAILDGHHPLTPWLDATGDPPDAFPDGSTLHRLLASHPFPEVSPWSTRTT
jgi:hypothetical protein